MINPAHWAAKQQPREEVDDDPISELEQAFLVNELRDVWLRYGGHEEGQYLVSKSPHNRKWFCRICLRRASSLPREGHDCKSAFTPSFREAQRWAKSALWEAFGKTPQEGMLHDSRHDR